MTKWEYRTVTNNGYLLDLDLDQHGARGWELVSVVSESCGGFSVKYIYYFKRPKK